VRFTGGPGGSRNWPAPATGQRAGSVETAPRDADALQSLARALLAARLGEALVLRAARTCRMDDLQQVV